MKSNLNTDDAQCACCCSATLIQNEFTLLLFVELFLFILICFSVQYLAPPPESKAPLSVRLFASWALISVEQNLSQIWRILPLSPPLAPPSNNAGFVIIIVEINTARLFSQTIRRGSSSVGNEMWAGRRRTWHRKRPQPENIWIWKTRNRLARSRIFYIFFCSSLHRYWHSSHVPKDVSISFPCSDERIWNK